MDKRVIFAVAGSGKTTYIVEQLTLDKRALIITYTNNNYLNLKHKIILKFGHLPSNIRLISYFTFLYSFCYRPLLSYSTKIKGISFKIPPQFLSLSDDNYFIAHNRLYSNRIAKYLEVKGVIDDINERLSKYFDCLYIDEIQDLAGNDFNLLKAISKAKVRILFVGDFYQHTYDTSRDGSVNKNLHKEYKKYVQEFKKVGLLVDTTTLKNSYRCSLTTCRFIKENLEIEIDSNRKDETQINNVQNQEHADEIFYDNSIVKLFYKEHHKYDCYSRNWGDCKGEDKYRTIAVVLNNTTKKLFDKNDLNGLNPHTKNKFYVACSRARENILFVSDAFYKKYKRNNP